MEQKVLSYHRDGNWEGILEIYSKTNDIKFDNKLYLWIQPSKDDLKFIEQNLLQQNVHFIFSVGCGTGLFEWLIQSSTGIYVTGIEIDRKWWDSKYAPPRFIPLTFVDGAHILKYPADSAIMFCYFNNKAAFYEYMEDFKGFCLIIIGPGRGTARHTDPTPFDPEVHKMGWILSACREIQNTQDYIAIYKRHKIMDAIED